MTNNLKFGVVGAGSIFQWGHSEPLKNHPELEIAAICDLDESEGTEATPHFGDDTGGHGENLSHFIDVVTGRAKPVFTIEQGVDMINILSTIYESAHTGSEVKL